MLSAIPTLSAEGPSREDAIQNLAQTAQGFFANAERATIELDLPNARRTIESEIFVSPEADKQRQEWAERKMSVIERDYPAAAAWLQAAGLSPQDPADPTYQQYLAELAAMKQRQREEAEREAESDKHLIEQIMNAR